MARFLLASSCQDEFGWKEDQLRKEIQVNPLIFDFCALVRVDLKDVILLLTLALYESNPHNSSRSSHFRL